MYIFQCLDASNIFYVYLFEGIAYLLRILGVNNEFDSLKWFQSVTENYEAKLYLLKTQEMKALKDDAKLQQPLSLSQTRMQVYYKVRCHGCSFDFLIV